MLTEFFSSTEKQLLLNMKFGLQELLCQSLAFMDCKGLDKILNSLEISSTTGNAHGLHRDPVFQTSYMYTFPLKPRVTAALGTSSVQQDAFWWGHNLKLYLPYINPKFISYLSSMVKAFDHKTIKSLLQTGNKWKDYKKKKSVNQRGIQCSLFVPGNCNKCKIG